MHISLGRMTSEEIEVSRLILQLGKEGVLRNRTSICGSDGDLCGV